ncbi:exonuclease [Rhodococcus phage Finch]|uniref:Exonuclease n=1 Tax=Rhodococcus phage Finch TaxID=2094144 RepID=A0A2P1JXF6_9CAUD|nr:exonuclease [Rhodococcus phage Finch]AVO25015.1 exonuclease [Rhodococcus phage Finch]
MTSSIFKRLYEKQLVMPYLENAFHNDNWPDQYFINVDSSPYYGLMDEDGVTHETGAGDGYFHPSTHPLMSERELYYRFHPLYASRLPRERRNLTSHLTLAAGSAMHATIQTMLDMSGILKRGDEEWHDHSSLVKARYAKNNLGEWEYIREDIKLRGRSDGVIKHPEEGEFMLEFKTMNSRMYRILKESKEPWSIQTELAADQYGVDLSVILVMEMGYPFDFKEFHIPRRTSHIEPIYEKFDRVLEAVKRDTPPPCSHAYASTLSKHCPVSQFCWPSIEAPL